MIAAETSRVATTEFDFSERDFQRIRERVLELTGISLSVEKRQLVYSRFAKRLRALGLNRFDDYLSLVDDDHSPELDPFISAITTNFTSFFREPHHFDFLLPHVQQLLLRKGRARIWSAGCSSGEEPYSMVMTLAHGIPDLLSRDIKILATDLDSKMVAAGQAGIYPLEKINELPVDIRRLAFQRGSGANAGVGRVRQQWRELVSFRQLNLLGNWPMRGPFDVIFCRNVIIYFSKDVQKKLFAGFSAKQTIGDYLIIGHSENLSGVSEDYKLVGRTIYQKVK